MRKSTYKIALISSLCIAVGTITGCQITGTNNIDGGIVKKDPEKAVKVRTQMAVEYLKNGDLDSAKRELDQALQANSRDAQANMMMGVLLQQEGSKASLEKADAYFKRALSVDSKNAQVRNNYGTYLYQVERYNDALEQLNIAGSTLGYDQRARALENAGRIYLKLGNVASAEKTFKQALQANRDSYVSMLELAEIFYLNQQTAAATQMYEQFVRTVGQNNQSARALWIGIRTARANKDDLGQQVLVNQLRALFPESPEYQRYLQLQYSTEAVWK